MVLGTSSEIRSVHINGRSAEEKTTTEFGQEYFDEINELSVVAEGEERTTWFIWVLVTCSTISGLLFGEPVRPCQTILRSIIIFRLWHRRYIRSFSRYWFWSWSITSIWWSKGRLTRSFFTLGHPPLNLGSMNKDFESLTLCYAIELPWTDNFTSSNAGIHNLVHHTRGSAWQSSRWYHVGLDRQKTCFGDCRYSLYRRCYCSGCF